LGRRTAGMARPPSVTTTALAGLRRAAVGTSAGSWRGPSGVRAISAAVRPGAVACPAAFSGAAFLGAAFLGAALSGAAFAETAFSGAACAETAFFEPAFTDDVVLGEAFVGATFDDVV